MTGWPTTTRRQSTKAITHRPKSDNSLSSLGERSVDDVFFECYKRRDEVPKQRYKYCSHEQCTCELVHLQVSDCSDLQLLYLVFWQQKCLISTLAAYGYCAHQQLDHVDCCKRKSNCLYLRYKGMIHRSVEGKTQSGERFSDHWRHALGPLQSVGETLIMLWENVNEAVEKEDLWSGSVPLLRFVMKAELA